MEIGVMRWVRRGEEATPALVGAAHAPEAGEAMPITPTNRKRCAATTLSWLRDAHVSASSDSAIHLNAPLGQPVPTMICVSMNVPPLHVLSVSVPFRGLQRGVTRGEACERGAVEERVGE
jgi:hypothetical protein